MRRNMSKVISVVLTMSLALSMCACSAKSSADTENTTAEAETEIETETEEETEEETVDASGNDPSGNDVSDNDVLGNDTEDETEEGSEEETESKTKSSSEEEEEESPESESTNSKTSEKDSTKSETTTSETTTEAVTVQGLSAVVSGTHYVGETLTGADFTVTVKMSDGSTLTNPAGWSAQPLTLSSTSNLITISYQGASVTITVPASVQETTAATVASNTTTTTTTKAETTQAATTQATTAATTAAETTTAASEWIEDGGWSYDFALVLFEKQNELRTEAGVDALTWDEQCYEVAKQCAKVCGDNGVIDHSLTTVYRNKVIRQAADGQTLIVTYDENLQCSNGNLSPFFSNTSSWDTLTDMMIQAIKDSSGHYEHAINDKMVYGAVGVYRSGNEIYVSYIFQYSDEYIITQALAGLEWEYKKYGIDVPHL